MNVQTPGQIPQVPHQQALQGAAQHIEIEGTILAGGNETTELVIPAGVNIVYSIFYQLISASDNLGPIVGSETGFITVARDQNGTLSGQDRSAISAFGAPACNMGVSDTGEDSIGILVTNQEVGNPSQYKAILTLTALQVALDIAVGA